MKINSVLIDDLHPFFRAAPVQCGHIDRSIITNISGIIRNTTISIIGHFHISSPPRQPFCILVQYSIVKVFTIFQEIISSWVTDQSWSNVFKQEWMVEMYFASTEKINFTQEQRVLHICVERFVGGESEVPRWKSDRLWTSDLESFLLGWDLKASENTLVKNLILMYTVS